MRHKLHASFVYHKCWRGATRRFFIRSLSICISLRYCDSGKRIMIMRAGSADIKRTFNGQLLTRATYEWRARDIVMQNKNDSVARLLTLWIICTESNVICSPFIIYMNHGWEKFAFVALVVTRAWISELKKSLTHASNNRVINQYYYIRRYTRETFYAFSFYGWITTYK